MGRLRDGEEMRGGVVGLFSRASLSFAINSIRFCAAAVGFESRFEDVVVVGIRLLELYVELGTGRALNGRRTGSASGRFKPLSLAPGEMDCLAR